MELTGKVKVVGAEISINASYAKRELVITTDEQYPQTIAIEFPQGKCNAELDKLVVGQEVTVGINVGGREWVNPQGETKYFNSIKGWKIKATAIATTTPVTPTPATPTTTEEENDDLPF